jgi:LysM repeat protein
MRPSVLPAAATAIALFASPLAVSFVTGCAKLPWRQGAPATAPVATVEYRVKPGDTLDRVAAWHGVEAEQVRRLNDLDRNDTLEPGRILHVPKRKLASYSLRSGDTLGQLGQWYGVDVGALIHLNDVADVRRLQVGRVIVIPATARRDGRRAALARSRATRPAAVASPPAVAAAPPSASPAPVAAAPLDRAAVDQTLARAGHAYDAADFDGALAAAQSAERMLASDSLTPEDRQRLARAHLLSGMSSVALGREEDARCSFREATAADRTIALDPARTSPKILTVFNESQTTP